MTPERDRLLAEKARIEAELAKLDEQATDPLWPEADNMASGRHAWDTGRDYEEAKTLALAALRRGMELAALPLAPVAEPFDVEALARECEDLTSPSGTRLSRRDICIAAIRETLRRRPWPSDAELEMLALGSAWPDRTPEQAAIEMAHRLKAYQQGEGK